MAYPIIILGAGASHDYTCVEEYRRKENFRPPLTNGLFNMKISDRFLSHNPEVSKLASVALNKTRSGKQSMEECLDKVKENGNTEQLIQLIELQFYLQDLFREITNAYRKETNNYTHLLEIIKSSKIEKVCFINFNYDLLLERVLSDAYKIKIKTIDSLIKNPIKVIKIHGAYNWGYVFEDLILEHSQTEDDPREFIKKSLQEIAPLTNGILWHYPLNVDEYGNDKPLKQNFIYGYAEDIGGKQRYFSPAIAIPLTNKPWVCPENHIQELENALQETDRILIIGWSAGDSAVLDLMKKKFEKRSNHPEITIVSSNKDSAETTRNKIKEIVPNVSFKVSDREGFTKFMESDECDKFFEDSSL